MSAKSWSSTLRLPKSKFPYRASPADRAKYLQRCTDDLYAQQQNDAARTTPFAINDGPPYANGDLHVGHALNKTLKDFINRVNLQHGKKVTYVPGWDCHGLPIEAKALAKMEKDSPSEVMKMPPMKVRWAARKLATKTVQLQMKSFKELGVMADWENSWTTMDKSFETRQLEVFLEMVKQGLIFRRFKPVYWSPSSVTALAEGELDYKDSHESTSAYIKYQITKLSDSLAAKGIDAQNLHALIWTTTPWTLPANKAIAVHRDLEYTIVQIGSEQLIVAKPLLQDLIDTCSLENVTVVFDSLTGADLEGSAYLNPISGNDSQPIIHADIVSSASGSGLVHFAPGHGMDDYEICLKHDIPAFAPVDNAGCFTKDAYPQDPDQLAGLSVLDGGSQKVLSLIHDRVLHVHKYTHKYPYDWRTKKPIIVRATAQWFADVASIKKKAIKHLEPVKFIPPAGRSRLESFIQGRNEWCISRQRAWGVPIPALYDESGEAVLTEESVAHIIRTISERGIDAWWSDDADEPAWIHESLSGKLRRGTDTMDVWFDSGTSWTFSDRQADVYLEGSDQHRGWFQSSLLTHTSASGRPNAPFKTLVTHGFTLDETGKKMSKSLGNIITPDAIMSGEALVSETANGKQAKGGKPKLDPLGADLLRMWAASSAYVTDVVMSKNFLRHLSTIFVKYRTMSKMLLGSAHEHQLDTVKHPLRNVDYMALVHLQQVSESVFSNYSKFEFHKGLSVLNEWLATDLSAFYIDASKDRLYCGDSGGVHAIILAQFLNMLAPITPLLVEEVLEFSPQWFKEKFPHPATTIIKPEDYIAIDAQRLETVKHDLPTIQKLRSIGLSLLDQARSAKQIGSSLQASIVLHVPQAAVPLYERYHEDILDICLVSGLEILPLDHSATEQDSLAGEWSYTKTLSTPSGEGKISVVPARDHKCPRCWRYVAKAEDSLCRRCEDVVGDAVPEAK